MRVDCECEERCWVLTTKAFAASTSTMRAAVMACGKLFLQVAKLLIAVARREQSRQQQDDLLELPEKFALGHWTIFSLNVSI